MSTLDRLASERWAQGEDCAVVVAGEGSCVAVVGIPDEAATPEDWARLPLIIAAPEMLDLLRALTAPLQAAADDCVKVDPADMSAIIGRAAQLLARFAPRREQMDNPLDGRGPGVAG